MAMLVSISQLLDGLLWNLAQTFKVYRRWICTEFGWYLGLLQGADFQDMSYIKFPSELSFGDLLMFHLPPSSGQNIEFLWFMTKYLQS